LWPAQAKLVKYCLENKRVGGGAQVVEYLPSMLKALGLIPSTIREKKKKELHTIYIKNIGHRRFLN
jgi:hypothetical protein